MSTPLALHPVTGAIGAEIVGFDVAGLLRSGALADYAAALKAALHRHHVLFLRDQAIDRAGQKRLTALFGPLTQVPYVEAMADDPEVIAVLKEANEAGGGVFGGDWHSDFSFLAKPPAGSVLVAVEVPPFGGDTLWANQELALETLPAELRRQIAGRDGIHSGKPYGVAHAPPPETQSGRSIKMTRGDPAADREQAHPLIRRHPESGADALFV
ncbi:MAG: TauD/TfdA family dioxygenase, partial [Pseudomonadota bacterium]|nr:TauD/TfdA family dioxygenase [Pseudomonadota bacterium]